MSQAKLKALTTECTNNKRQMQLAWQLYADDNQDQMVWNDAPVEWVSGDMSWNPSNTDNTNTIPLTQGLLGPYTARQVAIYKCPADKWVVPGAGARVRSIAMNTYLDRYYTPKPENLIKVSDVVMPSAIWVFLDEHPDSIDDGLFSLDDSGNTWTEMPAWYHSGNACVFSFVDGHCELHKWVDPTSLIPVRELSTQLGGVVAPAPNNHDITWIRQDAFNH
jgi:prepilin-type processing-associated H-X9-DG protein